MTFARAVFLAFAFSVAWPSAAHAQALREQLDERSLAQGGVVQFQRGVFRVAPDGGNVQALCLATKGEWRYVGSQKPCGNPPPKELQPELAPFPKDVTFLGVRNLGVTKEQWELGQRGGQGGALRKIGDAFSYRIGKEDVEWRLDSAKLPDEVKAEIPGSGIHVHFGHDFSDAKRPAPFTGNGALVVEARLAVPVAQRSGRGHSGVSIAVQLDIPGPSGKSAPLPVIVSVLNADPKGREAIRSDGRRLFASTYFGPSTRYIDTLAGQQHSTAWTTPERFAFRLTAAHLRQMIASARAKGGAADNLPEERQAENARVASVTLRNESRFLDQGAVVTEVRVDYLNIRAER